MTDIAVVIPCYNGAAYLRGAIESALEQSHAPRTVLVVDDASTDESAAIAQSFAANDHRVHCLRLERNGGPGTARNAGIAHVEEPFVAFLDADDRWTTGHCETLLALLMQHPNADLAFACASFSDPEVPNYTLPVPAGVPTAMVEYLLDDSFIAQSAVMARRSCILAVGGYTDGMRYSEDYDLWLRMAHGRYFIASTALTCIRTLHPGQVTRHARKMYQGGWEARNRYSGFANRVGPIIAPARYAALCSGAYERNLAEAWRSRSLQLLRSVLELAERVPGGVEIRRRWLWRTILLWPWWRVALFIWDALPSAWRRSLREIRKAVLLPGGV